MILPPEIRKLILSGKKRQHRVALSARTKKMRVGQHLDIRKEEKAVEFGIEVTRQPIVLWVEIIAADEEVVEEITEDEAKAEGYSDRDAFLAAWREVHPNLDVCWCITWRAAADQRIPALTGRGDEHGYSRTKGSAIPDEPESMADAEQMEDWATESREALLEQKRKVWEEQREKMVAALEVCDAHGVGGRELFIVRKRIEAHDRKLMREAA